MLSYFTVDANYQRNNFANLENFKINRSFKTNQTCLWSKERPQGLDFLVYFKSYLFAFPFHAALRY